MRLVRLYSNQPNIFSPIAFNEGLSVVLAEIRRDQGKRKTVHNLGKSTVARLIDFCLLKGRHSSFFLFKHEDIFANFTFFLELQLGDGNYITVARSVDAKGPVSILTSTVDVPDATELEIDQWSHVGLGISPAKRLLDGLFGFSVISPYDYRDIMGYVLREQDDYSDVFHLRKFRGKHREWKPFLAHLLGFNAELTVELYDQVDEEEKLDQAIYHHQREAGTADNADVGKLDGIIAIRTRELDQFQSTLDTFDFSRADAEATEDLVEDIEEKIAAGNEEAYRLSQLLNRLNDSLNEDAILFSPSQTEKLFAEAGVAFPDQLKKDFEQLIEFNRAISQERRDYLLEQRTETEERLQALTPELESLQRERARLFEFLDGSDTIEKYKEVSNQVISIRADIASLDRQREALSQIVHLRQEKRQVQERRNHLQTAIEQDVLVQSETAGNRYREIQQYFDEIVHDVLDEHALLSVTVASTGSLEFSAEIVDSTGSETSAGRGFTFKKLLCIAFDLAVLRTYLGQQFPRFSFHDGVFESLEPRAKRRLISVLRQYADLGLQPVITTLDSDLPEAISSSPDAIETSEVVCTLHDDGAEGRLFRTKSF